MAMSGWVRTQIAAMGALWLASAAWATPPADCAKSVAPQRCEANRQGIRSCLDLHAGDRRACVDTFSPPLICRSRTDRCAHLAPAQKQCDALEGAARRQCVLTAIPPAKCATPSTAAQCQRQDAAERACIAETGSANRLCIAAKLR